MNEAQKYKEEKMKDMTFRKAYLEEKTKLEIDLMLDELTNEIKMEKSYSELMKGVKRIKRALSLA
jgi:hypothetical protein